MDDPQTLQLLADAELEVLGRMPWSSNGTFLVALDPQGTRKAIYKPVKGERPLWDFPDGLYRREAAAYELSRVLGWGVVPPTVLRDGPLGEGSVQLFVDAQFEQHYFTFGDDARYRADLEAICVFDVVANNTDRKSGHCLLGKDERIYAIDNGLSFHRDSKLRTVLWDYAGEPIPQPLLDDVARVADRDLLGVLDPFLRPAERAACRDRIGALLDLGSFPVDHGGRSYPWPLV